MLGTTTTRKPDLPSLSLSSLTCVPSPASSTTLTDQDSCPSADDLGLLNTDSESPPPEPSHVLPSTAAERSRSLSLRRQSARAFSLRMFSSLRGGDREEDSKRQRKQQRKRRTGRKARGGEDDGTAGTEGRRHEQRSCGQQTFELSDRSSSLVEPSNAPRQEQHHNLLVSMRNKLLPHRRNSDQHQQYLRHQQEEETRIPSLRQQTDGSQRPSHDGSAELLRAAPKAVSSHRNHSYMNDEIQHLLRAPERRSVALAPSVAAAIAGSETRASRVENFHRSLSNKMVEHALETFCKRTLSWENVEFIRQVSAVRYSQHNEAMGYPLPMPT